ncbi:Zinc finger CCCH domain-containing protein 44 [Hordeum vulgare]|nr:Zinc finger CCCH domain-containing protein 44 [Hordeum vulgare]
MPGPDMVPPSTFGASATTKISVDASLAGAIIGKGGVNTKHISRMTGAKLAIRDNEADPNHKSIELEGSFDQVNHASAMVKELILRIGGNAPPQAKNAGRGPAGGGGSNFKTKHDQGHGSGDNYIPHNCLGSQERLFMQPNFSYVALLRGYLDMTNGQHLLDHTDHELCVTSGEHTKSNVDAGYEDDLTDQSFAENLEDNDASTSAAGYQVETNNAGGEGPKVKKQIHTWNLDQETTDDECSCDDQDRERGTSLDADGQQTENNENEENDINEETIYAFLESERHAS